MLKYCLIAFTSLATGVGLSRLSRPAPQTPVAKARPAGNAAKSPGIIAKNPRADSMDKALADGDWKNAAKKWAEEDPAGFHAWLLRQDPAPPLELTNSLFLSWVLKDPDAAFSAAVNLPRRFQRDKFLPEMLFTLLKAGTHDELAIGWMSKISGEYSGFSIGDAPFIWKKSPAEAAALLNLVKDDWLGGTLFERLGAKWAAEDLDAARRWLESLPVERQSRAFSGIFSAWIEKDLHGALDYLAHEAETTERFCMFEPLRKLAGSDPAAAFQWWEENMGVPDSNTVRQMLGEWRKKDAAAAKQYVLSIEDNTLRRQFLKDYAADLQDKDGPAFVMSLSPGEDRDATALSVAFSWGRVDPDGALAYLRTDIPEKTARDIASRAATGIGYDKPDKAFQWANEVPENLREPAILAAIERWRGKDAVAAATAVHAMPDGPLKTAAEKALSK